MELAPGACDLEPHFESTSNNSWIPNCHTTIYPVCPLTLIPEPDVDAEGLPDRGLLSWGENLDLGTITALTT
jgi:hypothetical protein